MKTKNTLIIGLLAFVLTALAPDANAFLWFKEKEKKETKSENFAGTASNSQAVNSVVEGQKPQPNSVTQTGTNNTSQVFNITDTAFKEYVNATIEGRMKTKESEEETTFMKAKFPLWVALIGFSIGLLLLLYAIKAWRASSKSFDALYTVSDNAAAKLITSVEGMSRVETDPQKLSFINSILAEANKVRGQINSVEKK